jgi:hypothetical protein
MTAANFLQYRLIMEKDEVADFKSLYPEAWAWLKNRAIARGHAAAKVVPHSQAANAEAAEESFV